MVNSHLVTLMANILANGEFTLELWLLLPVIFCPVIQHALVTPEVYSTLVTDTEKFLEVGLHRGQLLPLVVLVMVLLVQQVSDSILLDNGLRLVNLPYDLVNLVGRLSVLHAEENVFTLELTQLGLPTTVTSTINKTQDSSSHVVTRPWPLGLHRPMRGPHISAYTIAISSFSASLSPHLTR